QRRPGGPGGRGAGRKGAGAPEVVAGRNSVLEALRAEMPAEGIYLASRLESDDRTKEILEIAHARSLPMFEASRVDLDRLTDGAVHQGVAMKVPPYDYRDADDLLDVAAEAGQPPLIVALDGITDPRNLG
ncbi:TrmH family RNA methyltransferase, partial [Promicromonospora kroppenstedtii]